MIFINTEDARMESSSPRSNGTDRSVPVLVLLVRRLCGQRIWFESLSQRRLTNLLICLVGIPACSGNDQVKFQLDSQPFITGHAVPNSRSLRIRAHDLLLFDIRYYSWN